MLNNYIVLAGDGRRRFLVPQGEAMLIPQALSNTGS